MEAQFSRVLDQWQALGRTLAELAEQLAVETLADELPGASVIEVRGEFNDDWLRTLRVRRVLNRRHLHGSVDRRAGLRPADARAAARGQKVVLHGPFSGSQDRRRMTVGQPHFHNTSANESEPPIPFVTGGGVRPRRFANHSPLDILCLAL